MEERKTIGFFTNEIDGIYSTQSWLSIKKKAEKHNCNLIVFEGRILDYDPTVNREHNIIYRFVDKHRLDGLIIAAGTLLNKINYSEMLKFFKQYYYLPLISMGVVIPGTTSIMVDNISGIKSLTNHLVKDHTYKRIAFIKGPGNNIESNDRFQGFSEVLNENHLEVDESIVFEGDFSSDSGYLIMKDKICRNINFDAVICANDDMAIGVLRAAKELNLEVPKDFALCGFDNILNAGMTTPPLTTVSQPISEMHDKALDLLIKKINNQTVDELYISSSSLVTRESCGCSRSKCSVHTLPDIEFNVNPNYKIHENIQTHSLDEFYNQITVTLKNYNVRSCFISKYSDGTVYYDDNFLLPEKSELIYAYYDYKPLVIESSPKQFRTKDLIPEAYIPDKRRFTLLTKPLFFRNEHFGFVVFEIENDDTIYFELLRGQISNTLKGAFLLIEREKMEECFRQKEQLASLGHLIGGISLNFNTPIVSIAGICLSLEDLVREYLESLDDPSVTAEDYLEIAQEMSDWLGKLKADISYISQIITAVKIQAVQLNASTTDEFTIEELSSRMKLLIRNNSKIEDFHLNTIIDIDQKTCIKGDVTNLVQVLYNIMVNAYQSYDGKEPGERPIDFYIYKEGNSICFKIKDDGTGIPDEFKDRIFKQMITSKGRSGTGISLLLSYSTILGKFGGKIWFESTPSVGTTFYISIPLR